MEFLIINGSPHMGNTWKIVELVRAGIAERYPGARFQEVHLAQLSLPLCEGCSACFRKGGAFCPHKGAMDGMLSMMERADGLIFAATTFNMMPNALAKNFMDHLCYLLHRPRFFTKMALVISSTGGVGAGKAVKYIAGMLEGIGYSRSHRLPVVAMSWNDLKPSERLQKKCRKAAHRFADDTASEKRRAPKWMQLMIYNLFRGMSRGYVPGTPYETEDGVHWTDAARTKRVYDATVPVHNPLKRLFGHMFFTFGLLGAKLTTVTYKKGD